MNSLINDYLISAGAGLLSNIVSNQINQMLNTKSAIKRDDFKREFDNIITSNGLNINADNMIQFLADNGLIIIENSYVFANKEIIMGSQNNGKMSWGNGSVSKTGTSTISAGKGCIIEMNGNAKIQQDDKGNVIFYT